MPEIFDDFNFSEKSVATDVEIASIVTNRSGESSHDGVFFKNDARNARLAQLVRSRQSCWTSSYDRNPRIVCSFHNSHPVRLLDGLTKQCRRKTNEASRYP